MNVTPTLQISNWKPSLLGFVLGVIYSMVMSVLFSVTFSILDTTYSDWFQANENSIIIVELLANLVLYILFLFVTHKKLNHTLITLGAVCGVIAGHLLITPAVMGVVMPGFFKLIF